MRVSWLKGSITGVVSVCTVPCVPCLQKYYLGGGNIGVMTCFGICKLGMYSDFFHLMHLRLGIANS